MRYWPAGARRGEEKREGNEGEGRQFCPHPSEAAHRALTCGIWLATTSTILPAPNAYRGALSSTRASRHPRPGGAMLPRNRRLALANLALVGEVRQGAGRCRTLDSNVTNVTLDPRCEAGEARRNQIYARAHISRLKWSHTTALANPARPYSPDNLEAR